MHLCLISPVPPPYGGIANWYLLISKHINNGKYDISLSTINTAPKKRVTEGRSLFSRVFVSGFFMLKKTKELKMLIKNNRPDIIHITTSGQLAIIRDILILITAKRANIPTVYHIRFGRIPVMHQNSTIEWKILRIALTLSSSVLTIDHSSENTLRENIPNTYIEYIPNPIDANVLQKQSDVNEKVIVFIGWVVKSKGIEELLSAWNVINENYKDYILKIIGPVNDEYLKELTNKYNVKNVIFTGEQKHELALSTLSESSIFVLPSYTEGFPNTVLEAMALKKPIIATSVGAIPDMLDNECGILIPSRSEKALVKALQMLLESPDLCKRIGNNAYNKLRNNYEVDAVLSQYIDLWNKLIEREKK